MILLTLWSSACYWARAGRSQVGKEWGKWQINLEWKKLTGMFAFGRCSAEVIWPTERVLKAEERKNSPEQTSSAAFWVRLTWHHVKHSDNVCRCFRGRERTLKKDSGRGGGGEERESLKWDKQACSWGHTLHNHTQQTDTDLPNRTILTSSKNYRLSIEAARCLCMHIFTVQPNTHYYFHILRQGRPGKSESPELCNSNSTVPQGLG